MARTFPHITKSPSTAQFEDHEDDLHQKPMRQHDPLWETEGRSSTIRNELDAQPLLPTAWVENPRLDPGLG